MKTNIHLQSWLRRAAVLLIALAGCLPIAAQEEEIEGGEAFYIYQNDGHFDGFFYDQVKQIRCSRLDTLGIEHDKYVSQEIVTEDSVYRIMLTAIDSVSYVQPEIRYAKEARFMADEGMIAYYLSISKPSDDRFLLRFSDSMPAALQPKVGDVLCCPNLKDYDEAFVGKVKTVRSEGGEIQVECGYIEDLSEVFEQFITVEQIRQVLNENGTRTCRRIAGSRKTRAEGNWEDITLFNLNTHLEGNINIGNTGLSIIFGSDIGFGAVASAVYKITGWRDFYMKTEVKPQVGLNFGVSIDGQMGGDPISLKSLPGVGDLLNKFTRIPFPASCPILYFNVMPEPFIRGEAHAVLSFNTGATVKAMGIGCELKSEFPYIVPSVSLLAGPIMPAAAFMPSQLGKEFKISAEINGMAQLGMMFPIELGTMDWLKWVAEAKTKTTLYAGPKLEGKFPLSTEMFNNSIFENLKDAELKLSLLSLDTEFISDAKIIGFDGQVKKSFNFSVGQYPMKAFPDIDIDNMEIDISGEKENNVKVSYGTKGNVFFPQMLGVGIYKPADKDDKEYQKLYKYNYRDERYFLNTFNSVEMMFEDLEPGEYVACPIIKPTLSVIPTDKDGLIPAYKGMYQFTISPQEMVLDPDEIQAEEEGGEYTVEILTSLDKPITCEPFDKWIKGQVVTGSMNSKQLILTVEENQTDAFRTGLVYVRQQISSTEVIERTVTVKQYGGLELSKYKMEFEAPGGEDIVNILTSYKPINIDLGDAAAWLSYKLEDRTLTITAKSNQGANRTATVIISAWSEKHKGISTVKLTISQKGLVDAVVEPTELTYPFSGGTQRVAVTTGKDVTFDKVDISSGDDSWLMVEKQNNHFNVTALPNTSTSERQATVTAYFTAKSTDGKTITADIPVTVTQGASTASVTPQILTYAAAGGKQTVTIDHGGWSYFDAVVATEDTSWITASVANDGTVTITVEENTSGGRREGTVFCYVTNELNPTNDQILYLPVTIKQASNVPEPPQLDVESVTTFSYRPGVYRLKYDTNLPKVTVETDVYWATVSTTDNEIIISLVRNKEFTNRSGYLMVYGYDDNDKMQKALAIPIEQGYSGRMKSLMETGSVFVSFKGAINGFWTDSEGSVHLASGCSDIPNFTDGVKITCTEYGEYGAHIVSTYNKNDEKLTIDAIINDVDEDIINSVSYSYDYASGDKYRHTRLKIANIPINGGSPDDGTVIETLTERTARMWGLVEETFGPYFSMDITTTVNGLAANNFSVSVLFQKAINP